MDDLTNKNIVYLGTIEDKTGAKVIVKHARTLILAPSELIAFYYEYKSKLLRDGHGHNHIDVTDLHQAVYIEIDNKIVGHIVFKHVRDHKSTWIDLSAVHVDYRRRGLYSILHDFFEKVSKEQGAIEISSLIHVNNIGRLKSAEAKGFKPQFYRMSKKI
jgi:GNAT superfamily N-acetyltransferase